MTHPLHKDEVHWARVVADYTNGQPRAAVVVRRAGDTLVIQNLIVLRADVQVMPLPDRLAVVDDAGARVRPSRGSQFVITVETFDPYHVVAEVQ